MERFVLNALASLIFERIRCSEKSHPARSSVSVPVLTTCSKAAADQGRGQFIEMSNR
jgi:hypothetical protein